MRLFIALTLPKKLRERIHRTSRPLREESLPVRWLDSDRYHVTLKFLGDVRRDRVEEIEAAIQGVATATPAFSTTLAGFGAFPTVRRPRVIWVGLDAKPELRCLKQDLEWALSDAGFEVETRAFHPHVTLGRAGERGGAGAFRALESVLSDLELSAELRVHSVHLMRSQLSKDGARYSVLSSARLG